MSKESKTLFKPRRATIWLDGECEALIAAEVVRSGASFSEAIRNLIKHAGEVEGDDYEHDPLYDWEDDDER